MQPLGWYAQKLFSSTAVLAHFSSEDREGAKAHNARQAFVCGLAHGLDKRLLMLAEQDYTAPLDYRNLLINYETAAEAVSHATAFFNEIPADYQQPQINLSNRLSAVQFATELRSLRLGRYLAENEKPESARPVLCSDECIQASLRGKKYHFRRAKGYR